MTTTVTVTAGDKTAYVSTCELDDELCGAYKEIAQLKEETRTFHIHSRLDIMITENQLGNEEDTSITEEPQDGS
jgi:predicted transcriptional regulator